MKRKQAQLWRSSATAGSQGGIVHSAIAQYGKGMELIAFGAAIAFVIYIVLKHGYRQGGGADLWTGLGFPYGPTGNLTSFGGPPIVSITGLTSLPGQYLTDMAGNILTDMNGQPLLDMGNQGGFNAFGPGVNNSQLRENPMLPKSAWPSNPQFG